MSCFIAGKQEKGNFEYIGFKINQSRGKLSWNEGDQNEKGESSRSLTARSGPITLHILWNL